MLLYETDVNLLEGFQLHFEFGGILTGNLQVSRKLELGLEAQEVSVKMKGNRTL